MANRRPGADGYFLSCTATSMINGINDIARRLDKPVVSSNQVVICSGLRLLRVAGPIPGLGASSRRQPKPFARARPVACRSSAIISIL